MANEKTHTAKDKSPSAQPKPIDKSLIKVTNLLENIERTFLQLDSKIGKYRIIEEIDRGGMAVVYKAYQIDLDRFVALKVLPANITINRSFLERFLSEAHAVAKLSHPNIVNIHEVSMENNVYFLAMDYIPGKNLFFYLNHKKPKLVEVLDICNQLADALAYAHVKKIIHRDLKLNNVIMRDNRTPVLIDFGLAKAMGEEDDTTKTGEIMGSPAYMAPERILGRNSDSRSDICSMGIMLYEMLTFKNPYLDPRSINQTTINVIEANPVTPRKLIPWLPVEVEAITLKAMSKDPEDRYQTMEEFRDDLRRFQRGEHVHANPPSLRSRARYFIKRNWAYLSIGAITAIFLMLFTLFFYLQDRKEQWRWQLIVNEAFKDSVDIRKWSPSAENFSQSPVPWKIDNQSLSVSTTGFSTVVYNRLFARDIKFEFDIHGLGTAFVNAGFFAYGNSPDSSYCFHLHYDAGALSGITYPGSALLYSDYDPLTFPVDSQYHIVIEKNEQQLTFTVNGICIGRIYDYFPPLSPHSRHVGFFIDKGTCRIDNINVYQRAAPILASPIIIADRFMLSGEIESALAEYKELLLDFPAAPFVPEIECKIADCLIRLGRLDEARLALDEIDVSHSSSEWYRVYNLALKGMLYRYMGSSTKADKWFFLLMALYPSHPINQSTLSLLLRDCEEMLRDDQADSADMRVATLAGIYGNYASACGRMHLEILNHYDTANQTEKALATGETIMKLYPRDEELLCATRVTLSRIRLGKSEKAQAIDLLNQCITGRRNTAAIWAAWLLLAEIYETDNNLADALSICRKVFEECPRSLPEMWWARIKMGEISQVIETEEKPQTIFNQVAVARQPFIQPQLIARLYSDSLSVDQFRRLWEEWLPGDRSSLYYITRKALVENGCALADATRRELMKTLKPQTWKQIATNNLLNTVAEVHCQ
jgi:serine/threonine protein kinase/tetratricopeptide (TPR) repeat protein